MPKAEEIVNVMEIEKALERTKSRPPGKIHEILNKALRMKGLSLEEVAYLLNADHPNFVDRMLETAAKIKEKIYGERMVFFAPLYVSSHCVNDCEYCGFHKRNNAPRKKLTQDEIRSQVKTLEKMGHKRLLVEFGEDPVNNDIDYIVDSIKTIYDTKIRKGEIRRVNVNVAATSVEDYKKLKEVGIGTYQLFQETYHRETYEKLHCGPKADYERQLFAHDRAFEAGIDDVGLGVLFGLYDYRFEVMALVSHAQYLDSTYGVGPHTFSVPRWQPSETVEWNKPLVNISDYELLKIIAILRMAVPYTGMIISTRESPDLRAKAFKVGISQTSAASRTSPGGYTKDSGLSQFDLSDHRSLDDVMLSILKQGLLPSFCTACYREERTGKAFMDLAKPGNIHHLCRPNALLTFKEYLEDYASPQVKKLGEKIISKYLENIDKEKVRVETEERLSRIEKGERDIYF